MSLATAIQKGAKVAVAKTGKAVTYRKVTQGAYDTTTGKVSSSTNADTGVTGVVTAYSAGEVRGSIQAGDVRVLVAGTDPGLPATPSVKDSILIDAVPYAIVAIVPTYAQGSVALYEFQVRR